VRAAGSSAPAPPTRVAVIGAGFAGLATSWHLLRRAREEGRAVDLTLIDAAGIAAGASGASAGLLHPLTPRGGLLWRGAEGVAATLALAEEASRFEDGVVAGRGILRPARDGKQDGQFRAKWADPPPPPPRGRAPPRPSDGVPPGSVSYVPAEGIPRAVPGAAPRPADAPGGLLVECGAVLVPHKYLRGLWAACRAEAAAGAAGSRAALRAGGPAVRSARGDLPGYDHVVVAAGAASAAVEECRGLPLQFCHGVTLEMAPAGPGAARYAGASLLGPSYIARHGDGRIVVGATKEYGGSAEDAAAAVGQGLGWQWPPAPAPGGRGGPGAYGGAVEALEGAARALWGPAERWGTVLVRAGVRGLPPRTPRGALPLLGRVGGPAGGDGPAVWVVAGLGSRGLVYHALAGSVMAEAVLRDDPGAIPPELGQWAAAAGDPGP